MTKNNLKELGINTEYNGEKTLNNPLLTNKKIVITGTISFMARDEIKELIKNKPTDSNTDIFPFEPGDCNYTRGGRVSWICKANAGPLPSNRRKVCGAEIVKKEI